MCILVEVKNLKLDLGGHGVEGYRFGWPAVDEVDWECGR